MKIAILGCRGIPAVIGGFETFAEAVAPRLVRKGLHVTVYCQKKLFEKPRLREYLGVRLVHIPVIRSKSFEALLYDLMTVIHALSGKFDALYMLSDTTAMWLVIPRLLGKTVVVNTDGIEWRRSKWPWYGQALLKFNEWLAVQITPHLIVDSKAMGRYYKDRYDVDTDYITNGANLIQSENPELIAEFGLTPNKYFVVICRLEPENSIHTIIESFKTVGGDTRLAIAGGTSYKSRYMERLRQLAQDDPRIVFLGVRPDPAFQRELRTNCLAYVHGHQVGGTNPSLVEAMGAGNIILANDNPFNREVAGDAALYWSPEAGDLPEKMKYVIDGHDHLSSLGEKARKRCQESYSWDTIADLHDAYFRKIAGGA